MPASPPSPTPRSPLTRARLGSPTPSSQAMSNEQQPATSFPAILAASMARENMARLPCSSCRQNTHVRVRRTLPAEAARLPPVLTLNAGVRTAEELELWRDGREGEGKRFVLDRFRLARGKKGEAVVKRAEGGDAAEGEVEYELRVRSEPRSSPYLPLVLTCLSSAGNGRADPGRGRSAAPRLVRSRYVRDSFFPRCCITDARHLQSRTRRRSPALPGTSSTTSSSALSAKKRR